MRLLFLLSPLLASHAALAETVTDAAGRSVDIPDNPARIVVLHEPLLGVPLADFGVDPVGSYGRADDGSSLMAADFYASILGDDALDPAPRGIGAVGDIDLERLRALSPDLIIGTELDADKADQLTTIAPVYLQASSSGKVHGFETEEQLATLLDRTNAFEERRAEYQENLDPLKATIPPGQSYLAVIVHDKINLVGEMSGAIQAIEDLGYTRLPLDADGPDNAFGSTFAVPVSSEAFGRMNPDLLVVLSSYTGATHDQAGTRVQLDRIMPGWERFLKPAREGRIVWMDSTKVATPSVASAEHALDAIRAWSGQINKN